MIYIFKSNVKELMKKKKITMQAMTDMTGLSSATVNRARQDDGIAECRLSTLAKIGGALGVKTKRLYNEVEDYVDDSEYTSRPPIDTEF